MFMKVAKWLAFWGPWVVGVLVLLAPLTGIVDVEVDQPQPSYERRYCDAGDAIVERWDSRTRTLSVGMLRHGCRKEV